MATYTANKQSGTKTITASVVDTVDFDVDCDQIEVWGSGALTFRLDGVNPTVGDVLGYDLPAVGSRIVSVDTAGNTKVKLISSTGVSYNVTRIA